MINWIKEHKVFITIIGIAITTVINFFTQKHFNIGIDLKPIFGELNFETIVIIVLIVCAITCFCKGFLKEDSAWVWGGVLFIIFTIAIILLFRALQSSKDDKNNFSICLEKSYKERSGKTVQNIKEYCTLMYK